MYSATSSAKSSSVVSSDDPESSNQASTAAFSDTTSLAPGVVEHVSLKADTSSGAQAHKTLTALSGSSDEGEGESDGDAATEKMSSRAYQLEMLEQSLHRNVIVAMDTGSGKTQIAILRMKAEIERCPRDKLVWFLAPTVALCVQQFEAITLQMEAVSARVITGNDNVDSWQPAIWEAVLADSQLIVSTYEILLQAMNHAYITLQDLALIVFDEAHNCVKKNSGAKIMTDFYHSPRQATLSKPSILGLTASPSLRSQAHELQALEATLDAQCITPTVHRAELLQYTNIPIIQHIECPVSFPQETPLMRTLQDAYRSLDISEDPTVRWLTEQSQQGSDRATRQLDKVLARRDTFSQSQLKGLCSRSNTIATELGSWAADRYIELALDQFFERIESSSKVDEFFDLWIDEDKKYLASALNKVDPSHVPPVPRDATDFSKKVKLLLKVLLSYDEVPVGIIFAKERATVFMLYEMLSVLTPVTKQYKIGATVGHSSNVSRKSQLYDLLGTAKGIKPLEDFKSGRTNLLIATSVLEEGIDVPACNLVICFDHPDTSKAFIQRRGRARKRESKLIIFSDTSSGDKSRKWQQLEADLKEQLKDDQREHQQLQRIEDDEETGADRFIVESTGARLDFDNSKSHLEHFCRVLSQGEFTDSRPDYIVHRNFAGISATVLLPPFVKVELRRIDSQNEWRSEKNATKDAAFQAYRALYLDGLINENLLPFKADEIPGVETRLAEVETDQPLRPWEAVAQAWRSSEERWLYPVKCVNQEGALIGQYDIVLPVSLVQPRELRMFLGYQETCDLRFGAVRRLSSDEADEMPDHAPTLLALNFAHRWPMGDRQMVIKISTRGENLVWHPRPFSVPVDEAVLSGDCLVRDSSKTPYLFKSILPTKPPVEEVQHPFYEYEKAPTDVQYLHLERWTKRSDFLHPIFEDPSQQIRSIKPLGWVLPITAASIDSIATGHVRFGMLIPSIIHEFEMMMVSQHLSQSIVKPLEISDQTLIRTAVTSRGANEPTNYERLEFLGDSILKYCACIQTSRERPEWPEGYLSFFRDRLIANSRLSRACMEQGLVKYIMNKPFTGQKWRPLYVDDLLKEDQQSTAQRKLSTKTLADVVEALIGAAFQAGGISKSLACISLFLTELKWEPIEDSRRFLFSRVKDDVLPQVLEPLEPLIGYKFQKPALLTEAMTHSSFAADKEHNSLERLEFLGDSILDNIVVTKLFARDPPLSHHQMHLLKTAMVNGDFLAFIVLEHGYPRRRSIVTSGGELGQEDLFLPLWRFMRHASAAIGLEHLETSKRYEELKPEIREALRQGTHYPWALLSKLRAKKFYSDLFEAMLGAVWVDSGSMEACEAIVERFGILGYLRRILADGVHVQHPKEELGKWALDETVTYDVQVVVGGDGEREYQCRVLVGKRVVVDVDGGVSREEVKTKAAEQAVRILSSERGTAMQM